MPFKIRFKAIFPQKIAKNATIIQVTVGTVSLQLLWDCLPDLAERYFRVWWSVPKRDHKNTFIVCKVISNPKGGKMVIKDCLVIA